MFKHERLMPLFFVMYSVAGTADLEEHHYLFLKKLCQLLTAIGSQLAAMWVSGINVLRRSILSCYCLLQSRDPFNYGNIIPFEIVRVLLSILQIKIYCNMHKIILIDLSILTHEILSQSIK